MDQRLPSRRGFLKKTVVGSLVIGTSAKSEGWGKPRPDTVPLRLEPSEPLRVGLLGCGNRSSTHILGINRYEQIEVVALCDIAPERMHEKSKLIKKGKPRLFTDYTKMLRDSDIQALVNILPNHLHRETTVAALSAGKHVLCEKPLGLTVGECHAMIEAAEKSRRVLQVGTQHRFSPNYVELAKQIHGGLAGNVLNAWIQTFRADWVKVHPDPSEDARINWRMRQEQSGGVIFEMGIHAIDLFQWFINSQPVEVACMGGFHNTRKLESRDSWDHATVVVRYANDAVLTYGGNLYTSGGRASNLLFGDAATLEIASVGSGSNMARLMTSAYWRPFREQEKPSAEAKTLSLPEVTIDPSYLQYERFLQAIEGKKPAFPSGRDHIPAIQIARGALMAAAERRSVKCSEVI
ncbi:MAG: Gfo/Idh/MocA family oxidoreductase [Acidobacteriota bacterium]